MHVVIPGFTHPYVEGDRLDFRVPLVWTVDGVFDAPTCEALCERIDAMNPEVAPITTARGPVMNNKVRNNERVMFDDASLAADLYHRLLDSLPPSIANMTRVGNNERFRGYRYQPGQRFAPHYDGSFARNDREFSVLTLLVYLNENYAGGTTNFCHYEKAVTPKIGRACLFQHLLLHEGAVLTEGVKYVLRTDVMYARE